MLSSGLHRLFLTLLVLGIVCSCAQKSTTDDQGATPDPRVTIETLLKIHDLLGKQPEERSAEAKNRPVDEEALKDLIADFHQEDPFLVNLYVGFVVGALARYQTRLAVTVRGNRAEVRAGKLQVVMRLVKNEWLIVLNKTIPKEIKIRAKREKRRFGNPPVTG